MNQETIQAINQWASQIQHAIVSAAPKVWEVATTVKRADSIGAMVTNGMETILLLALAAVLLKLIVKPIKLGLAADEVEHDDMQWPGLKYYVAALPLFCGAITALCMAWTFFSQVAFDQWIWIGATNPGLAVSHDIILKVLGQ